jgi:hypothetical protein
MIKPIHTTVLIIFAFATGAFAQKEMHGENDDLVQFSGVVVTGDSLKPVPFSHIINLNSGFGTVSDYNGYFSFVASQMDTIRFTAVGFKEKKFVIPDTIHDKRYTMFQVMTADTIYLSETVIYPWPSREDFKDAFLNLEIPDDSYDIAMRNLEQSQLLERAEHMTMDGSENYQHYIDQTISKYYYAGQTQPITILNPFAWAQFIKAWKDGKFKRRD